MRNKFLVMIVVLSLNTGCLDLALMGVGAIIRNEQNKSHRAKLSAQEEYQYQQRRQLHNQEIDEIRKLRREINELKQNKATTN